jgi:hypothetical protein
MIDDKSDNVSVAGGMLANAFIIPFPVAYGGLRAYSAGNYVGWFGSIMVLLAIAFTGIYALSRIKKNIAYSRPATG